MILLKMIFFAQKDFTSASFLSLILKGEAASGKTHMLRIFTQKFPVEFLKKEEISDFNLNYFFERNKFYILENVDEIMDENLLFHLINCCLEGNAFLIFTTKNNLDFKLKDLVSRVKNFVKIEIENPSLESIKLLLANQFSRRQIKVSKAIIDSIANNINRNYEAIFSVVKKIDFFVQEGGKKLTAKIVKQFTI